jgi:hypothetical protein
MTVVNSNVVAVQMLVPEAGAPVPWLDAPFGGQVAGHTVEEIPAFGCIPDPTSGDRRSSWHIQAQPDADDLELGRAMRVAKIRDIESSTGLSVNTSFPVLHFSEHDIVDKADKLGVSVGENSREVATSINELLDLEEDRATSMLKNIAAVKPMEESEINELRVHELEYLCEDLVPTSLIDTEILEVEGHAAPL